MTATCTGCNAQNALIFSQDDTHTLLCRECTLDGYALAKPEPGLLCNAAYADGGSPNLVPDALVRLTPKPAA